MYIYIYILYNNVAMYRYSASVDVQKQSSTNMAMVTHMSDVIHGTGSAFVPCR